MKYFAIKVKENKELLVKENILRRIKDINIHVPVLKTKIRSGNHLSVSYERSFPEYIIAECEDCLSKFKKMNGMENIEEILLDEIPVKEIKKFLKEETRELYPAEITDGIHNGEIGTIDKFDCDFVFVQLKNKNKVKIPIWNIEQRIAIDDLMERVG